MSQNISIVVFPSLSWNKKGALSDSYWILQNTVCKPSWPSITLYMTWKYICTSPCLRRHVFYILLYGKIKWYSGNDTVYKYFRILASLWGYIFVDRDPSIHSSIYVKACWENPSKCLWTGIHWSNLSIPLRASRLLRLRKIFQSFIRIVQNKLLYFTL